MSFKSSPAGPVSTGHGPFRVVTVLAFALLALACSSSGDEAGEAVTTTTEDQPIAASTTPTSTEADVTADPEAEADSTAGSEGEVPLTPELEFQQEQIELGWSDGVRCRITSGDDSNTYEGPCLFLRETGGSFSVQAADGGTIINEVQIVSVSIVSEGQAEVRGLTLDGINSRWGAADRSEAEPACWTGSDFEVCAF